MRKLTDEEKFVLSVFMLGVSAAYHLISICDEFEQHVRHATGLKGKSIDAGQTHTTDERSGHGGTPERETSPDDKRRSPGWPRNTSHASL